MSAEIRIPVDLALMPRSQIEPVLAAIPPVPCRHHPHVLRSVNVPATIEDMLRPYDAADNRQPLKWKFSATFERCNDCPKWREMKLLIECVQLGSHPYKEVPVEPDVAALTLYEAWIASLKPPVCRFGGRDKPMALLKTALIKPADYYTAKWPTYWSCIECGLARRGVPPLFTSCAFNNYEPVGASANECFSKCQEFAEQRPGRFLFLFGNIGTGKTHLAVSVLRRWIQDQTPRDEWFIKFADLLKLHRGTYGQRSSRHRGDSLPPLERAQTAELLILDELRLAGGADEEPLLFDIISYRHEHMLSTVLTTNLNIDVLERELGSRIVDRIREAQFAALGFNWDTRRGEFNARYGEPRSFLSKSGST